MSWTSTGVATATLPVGGLREVQVGGVSLLLGRTPEGVFALDAYCPHEGGVLAEGWIEGDRLVCPLHQASFALGDGQVRSDPFSIEPPQGGVGPLGHRPARDHDGMIEVDLA